jgi:hypothetical protein
MHEEMPSSSILSLPGEIIGIYVMVRYRPYGGIMPVPLQFLKEWDDVEDALCLHTIVRPERELVH